MQLIQTSIVPTKMLLFDVCAIQNNLNIDLENATSWFIQNGLKPNPADKYQAMVLGKTEDKFNFKLADIDIKTGLSLITS